MTRARVILDVDYDPDLTGAIHWGAFATIFAAQAKVQLIKVEVDLNPPLEVETKPAPGTGASA
jgi:hypothetical protein